MDYFKKLSAELRLEIYEKVLITSGTLRRPKPHEETGTFASLLLCSKYIYLEAAKTLYSNNTFRLALADVVRFGNALDFCNVKRIHLTGNIDRDQFDEGGVRTLAQKFIAQAGSHAGRTEARTLALEQVEISEGRISPEYLQQMRRHTIGGTVVAKDVGLWEIQLGQSYPILLQHSLLHPLWAFFKTQDRTLPPGLLFGDYANREMPVPETLTGYQRARENIYLVMLQARQIYRANTGSPLSLTLVSTPSLEELALIIERMRRGGMWMGEHELIDVDSGSGAEVLDWANDVLLTTSEAFLRIANEEQHGQVLP